MRLIWSFIAFTIKNNNRINTRTRCFRLYFTCGKKKSYPFSQIRTWQVGTPSRTHYNASRKENKHYNVIETNNSRARGAFENVIKYDVSNCFGEIITEYLVKWLVIYNCHDVGILPVGNETFFLQKVVWYNLLGR